MVQPEGWQLVRADDSPRFLTLQHDGVVLLSEEGGSVLVEEHQLCLEL